MGLLVLGVLHQVTDLEWFLAVAAAVPCLLGIPPPFVRFPLFVAVVLLRLFCLPCPLDVVLVLESRPVLRKGQEDWQAVGLIIPAGVANSAAVWLLVHLSSPGTDMVLSISR